MTSILIPSCPGSSRVKDNRTWFVLNGLSHMQCTICPECYHKYAATLLKGIHCTTYQDEGCFCTCDFANELWNHVMSVSIRDPQVKTERQLYPIAPVTTAENRNAGYAQVAVPSTAPYAIEIKKWTADPNIHFTIEDCKVGSEQVTINHGKRIYYPDTCCIQGKATGTNGGFVFLSLTGEERKEAKTFRGYNESNIIRISVKLWRKQEKPRPPQPTLLPRFFFDARAGPIFGFEPQQQRDESMFAFGHSGSGFGSGGTAFAFGGPSTSAAAAVPSLGSDAKYSGGTTLSDSRKVDHMQTIETDATFVPELDGRTLTFTIQLICADSDAEKKRKNALYFATQIRDKLEQVNKELSFKRDFWQQMHAEFAKQEQVLSAQIHRLHNEQQQLQQEFDHYQSMVGPEPNVMIGTRALDEQHLMHLA